MWLYNEESKAKYAPANGKRPKKFQQALEEIVDWPDMLPYEGKSEEKHLDDSLEPDGIEPVEKKSLTGLICYLTKVNLKKNIWMIVLSLMVLSRWKRNNGEIQRFLTENYGLK